MFTVIATTETKKEEMDTEDKDSSSIEEEPKQDKLKKEKKVKTPTQKAVIWATKLTIISFVVSALISYLAELATNNKYVGVTIAVLVILVLISIIADSIGIAFTTCDIIPFYAMASKKVRGSKIAILLIKRNDKVASILNDLVGDIIGVISGACVAAVVYFFSKKIASEAWKQILPILLTALVASITIGGKAFMKAIAMKYSKEIVLAISKILSFLTPKKRIRNKKKGKCKKQDIDVN